MVEFDEMVIQSYVDYLYRRARWAAARWAGVAGIAGFLIPPLIARPDPAVINPAILTQYSLALGVVFFGLGWLIAWWMGAGFKFKLQAQTLLLQMQIEKNTRR